MRGSSSPLRGRPLAQPRKMRRLSSASHARLTDPNHAHDMAWRKRWLATALAGMLLAGLGAALVLALRSPEPAPVPSIELETDDRGRVRPSGRERGDRTDPVPSAPVGEEDGQNVDDGPDGSDPGSPDGDDGAGDADDGGDDDRAYDDD